ncbi:unnamed protein product [Brassica rapa]|uniref:Uncharacterized protein n=1 Tax=Brassica campestris TaxID=3711 RepID=A0A8D9M8B2_BRACM|nr:unnamed protein product [Brassica rapa]
MVLIFHSFKGFSDLRETLKDFSEDPRKTFQNTLGKSSNAFYARRLSTKSSGSLRKFSAQSGTNFGYVFCVCLYSRF